MMISTPIVASIAGEGGPPDFVNYIPATPGCNALTWHISRVPNADGTLTLNGPIWYENGSGTSFAQGKGTADGNFTLNVQKMTGNGPVGTITGTRASDGSIQATAAGSQCFAGTYHLMPGQTSAKQTSVQQ